MMKKKKKKNQQWGLHKSSKVFQIAQNDKIMEYNPWIEHSVQVTCMITESLKPLQERFSELK